MWRYLSLPTCLLSLWVASAPAEAAGSDGNARTMPGKEWSRAMKSSFFVTPPARLPPLRRLAQASNGEPDGSRAIPPEAAKAEAEKRWDDAERAYRAELAKQPNRVDLLLRLVDVLAAAGKKLEAAQTLARAADLRPSDVDLQLHASEGFAAVERPADALRYVDRALALRPDDLDVHRRRARLSAWAGDYAQTVESLRALIKANPGDAKLHRDLAQVLGWLGRADEGAKVLSDYVAGHPDDKGALLDLARMQSAAGDADAAKETLQRYRAAGGDEATYREELAKAQSSLGAAMKAEREHRYGDAERLYREMLAQDPSRVDVLVRLSDVLGAENQTSEGAEMLARAADLKPTDADLQLRASQAFAAAGRLPEAMRYSDRAIGLRPDDQALLRRRVGLDIWAGNFARAAETLRALNAANPNDPELKRELDQFQQQMLTEARRRAEEGDVDAAMQRLEHYRASGGDETIYRREREEEQAVAQRNAPKRAAAEKRWSEAERLYREQLGREPNAADLRLSLADVLIVEGRKREAAQAAAKAADLAKGDADVQVRASEAFAALGRPAEALKYVDRALALRRNDLDLHRRRAKLAAWAGRNAEAAASLKVLIAADPSDLSLMRDLGRIEGWLNHLDAAARLLSEYLAKNPKDLDALLDLARIEARRGKRRQVAELLRRYREAGGNEATFRRELAKGGAAAAKPATAAAATGGAATGPPVPPEVIKAEQEKRYGDAERLIRGLLAAAPQRVDLWIRLSQVLAAEKKTRDSAEALAKAADLQPGNVDLQLQAASGFGSVDRPADALRYVDRALAARPNDLALHKRRILTANWAGKYAEAEESQRVLIAANPADMTLKRDLGRILGWAGRTEEAADILAEYLEQQPADKEALLELSRLRAGQGNGQAAADLLARYRAAGGDELTYGHELSPVLAWSGRWYSALAIADAGLAKDPNDFTFHFARAVALYNGYETGLAAQELERLAQLRPSAPEVTGLRRTLDIAQRSYVEMDLGGKWESDNVATQFGEISYHQPVGDGWWVFAGGRGDPIEAPRFGSFAPIQGGSLMARGAGYLGAQARLDFGTIASARLGATGTGRTSEPIYQITADSKLSDELRVQLSNMRDLFVISPRALSLGLTQIDTVATVTYTPDMAWSFGGLAQEDEISDRNHAWHVFVSPRRAVLRSRYWNVDLGISGNWYGYTRKPPADGYYAPSLYQGYQTSAYIYYKMSEESGLSFVMSYGVNKDETLPAFKFTQDYAAEATFGALSDWMWKIRAAYSNHGSLGPNFSAESVGMTLLKRF